MLRSFCSLLSVAVLSLGLAGCSQDSTAVQESIDSAADAATQAADTAAEAASEAVDAAKEAVDSATGSDGQ